MSTVPETFKPIIDAGYRVFMRDPSDSWCHYTDGERVAYCQYGRSEGYTVSTVHVPNHNSGTGFQIMSHGDLTPEVMAEALSTRSPGWSRERDQPVKYRNFTHWHTSSKWNAGYSEVFA